MMLLRLLILLIVLLGVSPAFQQSEPSIVDWPKQTIAISDGTQFVNELQKAYREPYSNVTLTLPPRLSLVNVSFSPGNSTIVEGECLIQGQPSIVDLGMKRLAIRDMQGAAILRLRDISFINS